ncbi:MAG: pyridoxamine 5'-phosphate oxidase [Pseudomonadales bacterium]
MKLEDNRREYRYGKLTRATLADSPHLQFRYWMEEAVAAGINDPTAMTVSSINAAGEPWSRIVLLKSFDEGGLGFYTSLDSRKARDIESHPRVVLHFPWLQMDRQVIVGGRAKMLPAETSAAYFATRPRESQIAAWVATQSEEIASRQVLDDEFARIQREFSGTDVPMPERWGGYTVIPDIWEFWQGGQYRLHDRFEYRKQKKDSWNIRRLAP